MVDSANDVAQAESRRAIEFEVTDSVVVAPMLTWPGGQR